MPARGRLVPWSRERRDAYGAYAGLLVEFRQAMLHHWFCVHQGRDAENEVALRVRSFETRSSAQQALFRLQPITGDTGPGSAAVDAFTAVGAIDRAQDLPELVTRRDASRELIDAFVANARRCV
ncbi:hypothetical protein [Streptomyces yangpuensis]|uniref:hypothetical protein n=1 Tax=Streptomyces yangpuensis TaxID=1648182 RepID=UPI0036573A73